jgi:hypothetical protein
MRSDCPPASSGHLPEQVKCSLQIGSFGTIMFQDSCMKEHLRMMYPTVYQYKVRTRSGFTTVKREKMKIAFLAGA